MATEYTKIGRIRPTFKGEWNSAAAYTVLDIVHSADGSRAYAAIKDVPAGTGLTNASYWQPVVDMSAALERVEAAADAITSVAESAPAIVCAASGETISVNDASDMRLHGLKVFGKTTQDGTPSPDAPVELATICTEGTVTVTLEGGSTDVAQSIILSTLNGLPGIPVVSGGNYTDANGQQWVCDEIDLARGVYVQRVAQFAATGTDNWSGPMTGINEGLYAYQLNASNIDGYYKNAKVGLCSHLPNSDNYKTQEGVTFGTNLTVTVADYVLRSNWEAFLADQFTSGTPVTFMYCLAEPVETPLDEETIAAYAALYTNKPGTTVTNNAGAGMQMDYAADTKTYIDNKFTQLATALVANA